MAERSPTPAFVGRSAELALYERAVDDARDGLPSVLLVSGEAGIGKSRLVAEGARRSAVPLYLGRCVHVGGDLIPLRPVADLLRQVRRSVPGALADADLLAPSGGGARDPAPRSASSPARAACSSRCSTWWGRSPPMVRWSSASRTFTGPTMRHGTCSSSWPGTSSMNGWSSSARTERTRPTPTRRIGAASPSSAGSRCAPAPPLRPRPGRRHRLGSRSHRRTRRPRPRRRGLGPRAGQPVLHRGARRRPHGGRSDPDRAVRPHLGRHRRPRRRRPAKCSARRRGRDMRRAMSCSSESPTSATTPWSGGAGRRRRAAAGGRRTRRTGSATP